MSAKTITELIKEEFSGREFYQAELPIGYASNTDTLKELVDLASNVIISQKEKFSEWAMDNYLKPKLGGGKIGQTYEYFVFEFNHMDKYTIGYFPIKGPNKETTEIILHQATTSKNLNDAIIKGEEKWK